MVPRRYVKLTIKRARNVNALTGVLSGVLKAKTCVTAKASFKNLAYTTSRVDDMGQNPVWEEDGTSVFHFEFGESGDFVNLELFNRVNVLIGTSKLYFSQIEHLLPGRSQSMTLPVMVSPIRQLGDLVLEAEVLPQQAMGERGNLMVQIKKGQFKKLVSLFGAKTAKVKAKLTYKHATFISGVLENSGNKFIWQEDNVFTFMISSDVNPDLDVLKIEVYDGDKKAGEGEMFMSLFLDENDFRGVSSHFVVHTTELSLKSGVVGSVDVGAGFTPNPVAIKNNDVGGGFIPNPVPEYEKSSSRWTEHILVSMGYPPINHTFPPVVSNACPTTQQPIFYPDVHHGNAASGSQFGNDPFYNPSAPPLNVNRPERHSSWVRPQPAVYPPPQPQPQPQPQPHRAAGAPPGPSCQRATDDDPELKSFFNAWL